MATSAVWGLFEWGEAEWGSIEEIEVETATGLLTLTGSGVLSTEIALGAAGNLALAGAGNLTTQIALAAAGVLELRGTGRLTSVAEGRVLEECGHPVYAIEDWQNDE